MKKLIILIISLVTLIIAGCTQASDFQLKCVELSDEQFELLTLTGNRVFKYSLKNLPTDKNYELSLVYEVYKNNEKIKEQDILGMKFEPTDEKPKDVILSMNIQNNKIRCVSGEYGVAYNSIDIEEDIRSLSYQSLSTNTNINLGDEIYLFHGIKGGNSFRVSDLGLLSNKDKNKYLDDYELNVFIKLICEEK